MRRAVLDSDVFVSALISPAGTPAKLLGEARSGAFEMIASPLLLGELEEVLARDKFRRHADLDVVGHTSRACEAMRSSFRIRPSRDRFLRRIRMATT